MFKKSLQILFAGALLALAAIVGYALLRLRGAAETLTDAERLVAAGDHLQAIKVLDLCETAASVRADRTARQRLWRLRLAANDALDNARGALLDVENLLADGGEDDESLQLEHIRLLALADQGPRALQLARAFVDAHPQHPRGLELAGVACWAAAAEPLDRATTTIQRDLDTASHETARQALWGWLYRPDGDPEAVSSLAVLEDLYTAQARLVTSWEPLAKDLRDLRQRLQEGLGYTAEALRLSSEPVEAQRSFLEAMDRGQRLDDLLVQAEIHRRRVDDEHVAASGSTAAWALVRRRAYPAAIALAERWLPSGAIKGRIDAATLGDAAPDLMLARIVAAFHADDRATLGRLHADFVTMLRASVDAPIPRHLLVGLLHMHRQEHKHAEANLRHATDLFLRQPLAPGGYDLLPLLVNARLLVLPGTDAPEATTLGLLNTWLKERPADTNARLVFARYLLDKGRIAAACELIDEVLTGNPDHGEAFLLRVLGGVLAGVDNDQGGLALLAQCQKRRVPVPDVQHPIGYVLCAQEAAAKKAFLVARECARRAIEAFPRQRVPRVLEIEASLRLGLAQDAVEQARRLLEVLPVDAASAWMALEAHRAAGLPTTPFLMDAMGTCPPGPDLRQEILRTALARSPRDALPFALPVARDAGAAAALRLLAARALAAAGRTTECRALLDGVLAGAWKPTEHDDLQLATAAWLEGAAAGQADGPLATLAERYLGAVEARGAIGPAAMLAAAATLEPTHPRTAYALCTHALAAVDPESRNGAAHSLAGRLAAALGQPQRAEIHWLAALAFPDGRADAADCVRLLLAQRRSDRALAVFRLIEAPDDAAMIALAGDRERATAVATAAVQRDGLDLIAQATLATLGAAHRTDWTADDARTEARLELLAMLGGAPPGDRAVGAGDPLRQTVARAAELVAAEPGSITSRLLLARAHLTAGTPAEAARLHAELVASPTPLLFRELALAVATKGYVLPKNCETALLGAMGEGRTQESAAATVLALRRIVDAWTAAGQIASADQSRALLWQTYPREGFEPRLDLAHLPRLQNPGLAFAVLDRALGDPARTAALPPAMQAELRQQFAARGAQLVALPDQDAASVYATVLLRAAANGPFGCFVQFLLDHRERAGAHRPDDEALRALVLAHLDAIAAGRDDTASIDTSVDWLVRTDGALAAARAIENVVRGNPTCLPLWRALATVATGQRGAADRLARLRMVLAHAEAPDETLRLVTMALLEDVEEPVDLKLLDALPKPLLGTPAGRFARGLQLLRAGRPDDAVPLLADAPARPDGRHRLLHGLALLQSRDSKAGTAARACFEALASDYASSAAARYAGVFASQLAPR